MQVEICFCMHAACTWIHLDVCYGCMRIYMYIIHTNVYKSDVFSYKVPRCIRNYAQAITRENQRSASKESRQKRMWVEKEIKQRNMKMLRESQNKAQIWYAASTESKIQSSKADNEDFLQSWSVCSCARLATISWLLEAARGWRVLAFEWLLSYKYYNNSTTVINTTQQLIDNSAHLSAANEWQFKAAAAPQQRANSSKQVPSAI